MGGDDIVERLRSQANDLRQGALYSPSEDPSWDATTDAADEIERLRAEKPAPRWDDFRVYLTSDGRLRIEGWRGFVEPTCPTCNKPIAWVLDMMSFKGDEDGGFTAHHAHCVWRRSAFSREGRQASA